MCVHSYVCAPCGLMVCSLVMTFPQGLLDNVLSEYLWATAVLLTSPSVATVGLALTVKLATTLATSIAVDCLRWRLRLDASR